MAAKASRLHLAKHVAILRIVFGLMWVINALFKWLPDFRSSFIDQIKGAAEGQPHWVQSWIDFWVRTFSHSPHLFAIVVAVTETLIALTLVLGLARRTTYLAAALFSLLIWAIPEGFGGPYSASSTDIGTGIIYAVVFFSLYGLDRMSEKSCWSLDNLIIKRWPWWSFWANP